MTHATGAVNLSSMARALDRSDPAQATAILNTLVPDERRRELLLRMLASLAEIAARINPASWSITLQSDMIRLNVGVLVLFGFGRNNLHFSVRSSEQPPASLSAHTYAEPFRAMPGVIFRRIPQAAVDEPGVAEFIAQACAAVAHESASSRGPWRRAHSPGVVVLLERVLGRRLAWDPPGEQEPAALARSQAIQLAASEPAGRSDHRAKAIEAARRLIEVKLSSLAESDLRHLLSLFNQDLVDGVARRDRFKTGLVGNNANLLVAQLPEVNAAIASLWQADDSWLADNLTPLRASGAMPGGGWLFPTMILHTRKPEHYFPLTELMVEGLAAIDGLPPVSLLAGQGYLEYCERVRALLAAHHLSPHLADIVLWHGQRMKGIPAAQEPDEPAPPPDPLSDTKSPVAVSQSAASARPFLSPSVASPVSPKPAIVTPPQSVLATPSPARGSIGWLHLTDLHVGMQSSRWLWPNVLSTVFDDLARLHDLCGPWDLVLFTGDLTQRGSPAEFDELDRTFDRLWRHLERLGSRPRLVAVPGNHDLQRPRFRYDPIPLALSQWHQHRELRDHIMSTEDNAYLAELRRYFAPYSEWTTRSPWFVREGVNGGVMPGDLAASLSLNGIELGIVGLNSTFLQLTGDDYNERLDVHPRQLVVCGDYAPEWLHRHHINLLMTHHPPEWLEPRARQEFRHEIDAPGRFAVHFYGHMHEGTTTATRHGGGPTRHAIQGASLFGLEEYDGPNGRRVMRNHGYTAGRFEPVSATGPLEAIRVRLYPRKMLTGGGGRRIAPDHTEYELDERNACIFEVPATQRA